MTDALLLRAVRPWGGALVDMVLADGRIAAIGADLPSCAMVIDGQGAVVLPGLHDHHLHILALAARRQSVSLAGLTSVEAICAALAAAPPGPWVRAVDYDERVAGIPDAQMLDGWLPDRPLRLADRTGALRVLNSAGLSRIAGLRLPPGAETAADGRSSGRFWREDQWLAEALPASAPSLAELGGELAALGLTALTDAGAHNGPAEAALLVGKVPQRLVLMGSEALVEGAGYVRGPLKLLIDEASPPEPDALAARIVGARDAGRCVAAHCVTEGELALFLAALAIAGGARHGDRIEHGGMIPPDFLPIIAGAPLMVVTNPAFLHDRGDRYRATIPSDRHAMLYPAAGLARAGIALRAGSDAPYASVDPWLGMRSARDRMTRSGHVLGAPERLSARAALSLYGGRELAVGAPADLVVCAGTMEDVLADLSADRVVMTVIDGRIAFSRG